MVENLLKNIDLSKYGNDILEPSAGNGNVCSVVKKAHPDKKITAFEIRKEETDNLKTCADTVAIVDFFNISGGKYRLLVSEMKAA